MDWTCARVDPATYQYVRVGSEIIPRILANNIPNLVNTFSLQGWGFLYIMLMSI